MLNRIARRLYPPLVAPKQHEELSVIHRLREEIQALRNEVARLHLLAEPFHTRPGTLDPNIYHEVVIANEYRLPSTFDAEDIVIDVGAHIGSFATACLLRGAGHVVAFEPVPANYAVLHVNLARFGNRVQTQRAAVWRSDAQPSELPFHASGDGMNTGGGNVIGEADEHTLNVPSLGLDTLVQQVLQTTGQERIRLLKLDCEGSEYPILLTATCLNQIEAIVGEYHHCGPVSPEAQVGSQTMYDHQVLVNYLTNQGFKVRTQVHPQDPKLGYFWAKRPA